jgi:phosphatidylglycerophosphate synthase
MSKHLERKISIAITRRLVQTSITPNQMTLVSVLVGLIGAFFMGIHKGFWQMVGSGLFLLHSILDGCDGEIARIKFAESRWGGLIDFWGDNVVHSAVFFAIAWEWWARTQILFPFVLAALAIFSAWGSAGLIYWKTMRSKSGEGPMYTSVSSSPQKNKITQIADFLSRRDFIFLVIILAFFGHLDWFLYASAVGTPVFAGVLLGLMAWEKIKISRGMRAGEERRGK